MSRATYLADAIKDDLNTEFAATFDDTIRAYRTSYYLKQLKTLKVVVMLTNIGLEAVSRVGNLDKISIDIVFYRQADPDDLTVLDALTDIVQAVSDYLRNKNYNNADGKPTYTWLASEIIAPYDVEDLTNFRVFTSVIRSVYQVIWRAA